MLFRLLCTSFSGESSVSVSFLEELLMGADRFMACHTRCSAFSLSFSLEYRVPVRESNVIPCCSECRMMLNTRLRYADTDPDLDADIDADLDRVIVGEDAALWIFVPLTARGE